jgi:competence transcription factor ComK
MYIGLHVKYQLFLSEINETLLFSTKFRKMIKFHEKSMQWEMSCFMRTDRNDEAYSLQIRHPRCVLCK